MPVKKARQATAKRSKAAAPRRPKKPVAREPGDCPICGKAFRGLGRPCEHLAVAWSKPRSDWYQIGKKRVRRKRRRYGQYTYVTEEWSYPEGDKPEYVAVDVDLCTLGKLRQYIANLENNRGCQGAEVNPRELGPTRLTPLLEAHFRFGDGAASKVVVDVKPPAKAAARGKPSRAQNLERAHDLEETEWSLHPRRLLVEAYAAARGSAGHATDVPFGRRTWILVWAKNPKVATAFVNREIDAAMEKLSGLKARLARIAANPTSHSVYKLDYSDRCPVCACLKGTEAISGSSGRCDHEIICQNTDEEYGEDSVGDSLARDENYQIWRSVESLLEELKADDPLHRRLRAAVPTRVAECIERGGDFFSYQASLFRGLPGYLGQASIEVGSGMGTGTAIVHYSADPGATYDAFAKGFSADMRVLGKIVQQAIDAEVDFQDYLGGF